MKTYMSIMISLAILYPCVVNVGTAQVSVQVGVTKLGWHWKPASAGSIEWVHYFSATLSFDGVPASDMGDYTYYWEHQDVPNTTWIYKSNILPVEWENKIDDVVWDTQGIRVTVSGYDPEYQWFSATSDPITLTNDEAPIIVDWDFKDYSNQGFMPGVDEWFAYPSNQDPASWWNHNASSGVLRDGVNILRVPQVFSAPNQKFNHWNNDASWVRNHDTHVLSEENDVIGGKYSSAQDNTTISGLCIDDQTVTLLPSIQDPWLVDPNDSAFSDGPRGYRNLGMSAPFKTVSSGTNNLGWNGLHKGVFLNQDPNSSPVFYSVRAPLTTIINGSAAFFQGWGYDANKITLVQVGSNPAGFDQKAVVFKQAGAVLTAQYSASTILSNLTVPAGTYNIAGSLTVASGVSFTLSLGTTMNFPTTGTLVLNGTLIAQGTAGQKVTFSRRSGSSVWNGIQFTGSSANGSSLDHCVISYALQPVNANNVSSLTIQNTLIDKSNFNGNYSAAMRFNNSAPTVTAVTIDGAGYSSALNGVRFSGGSGGTIQSSTIKNLSYGNGIVVQGGSSPVISENTIRDNKYHGISVDGNGSGVPTIVGNSFVDNGIVNGVKTYTGMRFKTSTGRFGSNTVRGATTGCTLRTHPPRRAGGPDHTQVWSETTRSPAIFTVLLPTATAILSWVA